ncbi:MAG: type II CAAX endopeptidase family protein [Actinomycetota bacterium]|nr:type II CAAX endopeptidase family protein [Actinomycetota bacterium]
MTEQTYTLVGDRRRTRVSLVWFFVLALGLTFLLNNLIVLGENQGWWVTPGWLSALALAMFGGPSIAGLVMATSEGRDGVRDLFGRSTRWRSSPVNYSIAVGVPAIPAAAAVVVALLVGEEIGDLPGLWPEWWTVLVFLIVLLPLAEEFGWRAYALPRLLAVTSPMKASLVLGALWGLWHLPAAFINGLPQETVFFEYAVMWLAYPILTISQSILMTWLFLRTKGSALIAGFIFHAAANAWAGVLLTDATMSGSVRDPSQTQLWVVIGTTALLAAAVAGWTRGQLGVRSAN